MGAAKRLFLGGLAYEVGEPQRIADLGPDAPAANLDVLLGNGLELYRVSDLPAVELGAAALRRSLAAWGGAAGEIDLILYASETASAERASPVFGRLCDDLGLAKIPVIGLTLNACAGFAPALRIARGLFATEGLRSIALVLADRCLPGQSRVVEWDAAVFSDGAACCLITPTAAHADLEVIGLGHSGTQQLRGADPFAPQRSRYLMMMADGLRRAVQAACRDAGAPDLASLGIEQVMSTSSRLDTMRFYARLCGLPPEAAYTETLADLSHVYGADPIINLATSRAWRAQARGRPWLALAQGPHTWGAALVQDCA